MLFYCRAGFEKDLANEVQEKAAVLGVYGYPKLQQQSGFIQFVASPSEQAQQLGDLLKLRDLVFARQMMQLLAEFESVDKQDRISPILDVCADEKQFGDVRVEYPDTTQGRELSKFCRKFTVPLRQALRKQRKLTPQIDAKLPVLHVFFTSWQHVIVGKSYPNNHSPHMLGILRLKFPAQAPSRSTLKLDEAFQVFVPASQYSQRVKPNMQAVDLGACPGGWTYQLVQRGMRVQAVDNGAMHEDLMASGLVYHFAEDGFKFEPKHKPVDWLVCDMVEQPQRVAELMTKWIADGWAKEAIFNLKLPMKKRYESVKQAQQIIRANLAGKRFQYQAKHLYHDREEVTFHLRLL